MSTLAFSPPAARSHLAMANGYSYSLAPAIQSGGNGDRRMSSANETVSSATTVLIRKLPRNMSREALHAMLLFAKDLKDVDIVSNEFEDDHGFSTAIAQFTTVTGAIEAQAMLDGKQNVVGQANMIVEVLNAPGGLISGRRNTIDPTGGRSTLNSASPPAGPMSKSSRFNGTFQSLDRSPPHAPSNAEQSSSEGSTHLQTIFSPQSPVGNMVQDRSRISGKSVISQDEQNEDTEELLKDPVAYMKNDNLGPSLARRPTNPPQMPLSRFSALSLNTNMKSSPATNYSAPRNPIHGHTPAAAMSPTMGQGNGYPLPGQHFLRHNYPPVNPADQNPPCNTLYVGNLPLDTSEDELKAMFSKQRGYKRLCFRTKQNGPMCFVEFEDVSFATKALNELYGVQLHNSVKGGIRLSFSKNPLGVRAGQPGSGNPSTPLSATGPMSMNGHGAMSPGGFSTANGPPPGLTMPPGLGMPMAVASPGMTSPMSPVMMNSQFANQGLGIGSPNMHNMRGMSLGGTPGPPSSGPPTGGFYPDYMMGR